MMKTVIVILLFTIVLNFAWTFPIIVYEFEPMPHVAATLVTNQGLDKGKSRLVHGYGIEGGYQLLKGSSYFLHSELGVRRIHLFSNERNETFNKLLNTKEATKERIAPRIIPKAPPANVRKIDSNKN